jgi:hypothetical protein
MWVLVIIWIHAHGTLFLLLLLCVCGCVLIYFAVSTSMLHFQLQCKFDRLMLPDCQPSRLANIPMLQRNIQSCAVTWTTRLGIKLHTIAALVLFYEYGPWDQIKYRSEEMWGNFWEIKKRTKRIISLFNIRCRYIKVLLVGSNLYSFSYLAQATHVSSRDYLDTHAWYFIPPLVAVCVGVCWYTSPWVHRCCIFSYNVSSIVLCYQIANHNGHPHPLRIFVDLQAQSRSAPRRSL